ncbi:unnamed protein product [Psylliodes chrysocephalus]|uniref:Gustatory receptor n=1 Tax=Psylliodes chrysocephalus TaxID=3402493 RepID=A0A9P0DBP7_9CUCU|nr:unnamed protein product [Psylliodes chrysocephala]
MKLLKRKRKEFSIMTIEMRTQGNDNENVIVSNKNNLHDNMKFVIRMAQIFGVMPLHNLRKNWDEVYFKWTSIGVVVSMLNAFGAFISTIFWLIKFCVDGVIVDKTAHMVFYICTCLSTLHFINLARYWPDILKDWSYVEIAMKGYGNEVNLKRKFLWISSISVIFGTAEHILFIANGIYQSEVCNSYNISRIRAAMEVMFSNYYTFITFNAWTGIAIKMSNILATFTWIYTDLFISLLSLAMTAKFKQLVARLRSNRVMQQKFWREIREDYQRLYLLCKKIDNHLSFLVLVSYMHNIFFLCIQLYNSLRQRKGLVEATYFVGSFSFLVVRIIGVSMYGALLHDEARKPMEYLHNVPTDYYCTEISRLIDQIYTSPIGITGAGFFIVTRNFMLQMAGTIVTFELMLFQFAPMDSKYRIYNRTEVCINE